MVEVIVALIAAGGVALAAYIPSRRLRRENTEQHAASYSLLQAIDERTERTETKLDQHLGWHDGRGDPV